MSAFLDSDLPPETLARARAGAVDAQEAIYRAFQRPVRTLARRLVPGLAVAEDLAQDVFVEVLTKLDQYDGYGSFAGWVRSITVNKCLMHLRSPWQRARRWLDATGEDGSDEWPQTRSVPMTGDTVDLERALARLGGTARAVVWLHDVEGYTHAEIGRLLGHTASFSKSQLARACAPARTARNRWSEGTMHAGLNELLNLRARLRALPPAPDADQDAWPEIQARIARRQHDPRRRARVAGFATAASVAALGLFASLRLLESPVAPASAVHPVAVPAEAGAVAELRSRSQMLEALLAEMPARPAVERAATSVPIESLEARVQWLDHEISVADAQSRGPEAERLWRDRVEVMNSLVQLRYVEAQHDLM